MARNSKGGLGRGLNSLLGGAFETSAPAAPSPARERITVDSEEVPSPSYRNPEEVPSYRASEQASAPHTANVEPPVRQEPKELDFRKILERKLDEVPIDSISPNPDQPRTNFKQDEIEELAESIKKDGLLQPILVRSMPGGSFQIIAGERRWQACKIAGLATVPVRIKDVDDDRALELALVENIQRSDLNPIEEAYGYRRMMERRNMTQADVAQIMSKGRSTVANALRLLELPEEAQQLLFEDKITAGHARAILSIPTKEGRESLTRKLMETKLSVREAEAIARLLSHRPSERAHSRHSIPKEFKSVASALCDVLHTDVRVRSSKGRNLIEIEFKDEVELKNVFAELLASVS